ncbi:hypothetical protein ROHU_009033 [Labeo rohita]|uniref:Uncharacterized protein n=1 Tax=Labeo rohita TaxID=84645 RepID=A0A498MAK3_LABRO|nr:hypothetical protein ROHU_009033 [Labeo rohita]
MSHPDELQLFTSDEELSHPSGSPSSTKLTSACPKPGPSTGQTSKNRGHPPRRFSPAPARQSRTSAVSSAPRTPAQPGPSGSSPIPTITKWTVNGLRHALVAANIHFSRRQSKAQLYELYLNSQSGSSPSSAPPAHPQEASSRPSKRDRRASPSQEAASTSSSPSISTPTAVLAPPDPHPSRAGLAAAAPSPPVCQATSAHQTHLSQASTSACAYTVVPPVQPHLLPTSGLLNLAHPAPISVRFHLPSVSLPVIPGVPPSVRLPSQTGPAPALSPHPPPFSHPRAQNPA